MPESKAIVRCQATTPNPLGRWGHCACTLEEGHDGPHLCQSVRHHEWESDSGRSLPDSGRTVTPPKSDQNGSDRA